MNINLKRDLKREIYKKLYKLTDTKVCEKCGKESKARYFDFLTGKWLCQQCHCKKIKYDN